MQRFIGEFRYLWFYFWNMLRPADVWHWYQAFLVAIAIYFVTNIHKIHFIHQFLHYFTHLFIHDDVLNGHHWTSNSNIKANTMKFYHNKFSFVSVNNRMSCLSFEIKQISKHFTSKWKKIREYERTNELSFCRYMSKIFLLVKR